MKKYNEEELNYFGLSEQKLSSGESFEESIEREHVHNKSNYRQEVYVDEQNDLKLKSIENTLGNTGNSAITAYGHSKPIANEPTEKKYEDILAGDFLESITDQWHNGYFIPKRTIFTTVSTPKKVRKIKTDDENKPSFDFFVIAQTMLETGQTIKIRINCDNCRKLDAKNVKNLNEDLIW